MKNFLAVDTSGRFLTVLASKDGELFSTHIPDCSMRHSVSLLPAVEETLKKAGMRLGDCDFFSAAVGAGSFTGIRIAISAVKGFALALKKPTLSVTSFDVTAYNGINEGKTLCLVDALHDCYYACGYEKGKIILSPSYLTEEEVLSLEKEGYTLKGCANMPIAEKANLHIVDPVEGLGQATQVLAKEGKFGDLEALYVRKSSAELNQK